ncbi:MAG: hypothetical protein GXY80_14405 [Syntrophorhabdus aromaticivorans]|uniref:Uncharacterized protein n=1 Tax=Syntrophorhabdus aromaticivorans TaxID=328301 RepID=A0A971S1N0_9BACT|nr:hypothetical protein [Syntrophorhabdus aromaticivorans]
MNPSKLTKIFALGLELAAASLVLSVLINCSGGKMDTAKVTLPSVKDVPAGAWQELSQKKIYFGHHSVGFNIINGINDVIKENPQINLKIVETSRMEDFASPLFAHSRVGKNENPKSKCDAFAEFMNKGLGNKADIAFFKFCFVDVTAKTNVDQVFDAYRDTLHSMKKKYPETTFIHVTVPLMVVQAGPRAWVKKIIGRPIDGYGDNILRQQFNEKVRAEYSGKEPIFDLAAIESTLPDGARAVFKKDGRTYPCLSPAYTNDGGHLNEQGRKRVAEQLLILLAHTASSQESSHKKAP